MKLQIGQGIDLLSKLGKLKNIRIIIDFCCPVVACIKKWSCPWCNVYLVGNGHGDTNSNRRQDISHSTKPVRKGMN